MTKPILPNPYEDMSLAARNGVYDVLHLLTDGAPLGGPIDAEAAHELDVVRNLFDLYVLPVLLDPASFMDMPPIDRLRAVVDFVTIHPEKHEQSVWVQFDARLAGLTGEDVVPLDATPNGDGEIELNLPRPNPSLSCGTAACLAGWAAQFSGAKPVAYVGAWEPALRRLREQADSILHADTWRSPRNGVPVGVSTLARTEVFGLRLHQADYLFAATNSTVTLRAMVAAIEADPDAGLEDLYDSFL